MAALSLLAVLVACGRPTPPAPEMPLPRGSPPATSATASMVETVEQGVTAVTVVPGTRDRLSLHAGVGVSNSAGRVVLEDPTLYDDLVALDSTRVALIRENDGFVYELGTHRLLNRFCYLPDPGPAPNVRSQRSFVVGWDSSEQRLYVQPQTFENGTRVGQAQLGVFAADQALPLEWQNVGRPDMQAGGIAVQSRDRIWLGWGSTLYLYDANARAVKKTVTLDAQNISSLALEDDHLLVLDGTRLLSVPLTTLE